MDGTSDGYALLKRLAPLAFAALVAVLVWQLASVVLLFFGAVVVAVLLSSLAEPLARHTGLSRGLSLGAVVLAILALGAAGAWLFGVQLASQVDVVFARLPAAWDWIQANLLATPAGRYVLKNVQPSALLSGAGVFSRVTAVASTGADALTNTLLVVVGGAYLALSPRTYVEGGLRLAPRDVRPTLARAMSASGRLLQRWLLGQLIAMVLIGVLTGVGLAVIGTPSALALGLFAGLTEFIPLIGPFLGAAPALLTALSVSPMQVVWTAALFLAVQQLEGNLIQPFIQRRTVEVAPAVGLFALAALGVLFGPIGLVLAAPLTVAIVVWTKELYLRAALGEDDGGGAEVDGVD